MGVDDGINAARAILPHCEFDAAACSEGLKALRSYRKEWDEERGVWRDKPRHDWASHGADAFRCLACRYKHNFDAPEPKATPAENVILQCGPGGRVFILRALLNSRMGGSEGEETPKRGLYLNCDWATMPPMLPRRIKGAADTVRPGFFLSARRGATAFVGLSP